MSNQRKKYVIGILRVHARGFGFVIPDQRRDSAEDIFIPKFATGGAVDGDHVEVLLSPPNPRGPEGKVVKILERGRCCLGAVVTLIRGDKQFAYAPLLGQEALVEVVGGTTTVGERLLLQMIRWGGQRHHPVGKIIQVFGHINDPSCDVVAACAEYDIETTFPDAVIAEAQSFGTEVTPKDEKGRADFTGVDTITIDPTTAKDFDDALSLSKKEGIYHLMVHIADVSHYVQPGSPLDCEAAKRCNSVYFPGSVVPMLPHELSSHLCSLKADVKRLAITVAMRFTETGEMLDYKIERSVIKSVQRLTYEQAKQILDGTLTSPYLPLLQLMTELCHLLKQRRAERGSIEFALPDTMVVVDAQGKPTSLELVEYDVTHQLVEEFMLKANEVVATHLASLNQPLTYRIHEEPAEENLREFAALATALGFKIPHQPDAEDIQNLFDEARASPFGKFLMTSFIRSMKLASYSTQNVGHYGLRLEHYTHFTSPIRRYIDLIVHRVLFHQQSGSLDAIALQCSEKERLSAKAENAVITLKKLRYLQSLLTDHPHRTFHAVVTKVKPSGFSFELTEELLEGYLSTHDVLDEVDYQTGDALTVSVRSISLVTLEARWEICQTKPQEEKPKKKRTPRKKPKK